MTAHFRQRVDTTYADLRPTDLVIDKSGKAWPIAELGPEEPVVGVNFWLCDPVTGVKMHYVTKLRIEPVKVSRLPTQADEASKLEAEFPVESPVEALVAGMTLTNPKPINVTPEQLDALSGATFATAEEAVAAVEEIGGTVEAEVTAEEVDAAAAATDEKPLSLPPFADMTPLEQRSHLYLLHGLYGSDVTGKAELIAIHEQAHVNPPQSRHVPHVHE